jgi:hypothetical protein
MTVHTTWLMKSKKHPSRSQICIWFCLSSSLICPIIFNFSSIAARVTLLIGKKGGHEQKSSSKVMSSEWQVEDELCWAKGWGLLHSRLEKAWKSKSFGRWDFSIWKFGSMMGWDLVWQIKENNGNETLRRALIHLRRMTINCLNPDMTCHYPFVNDDHNVYLEIPKLRWEKNARIILYRHWNPLAFHHI